MQTGYFMNKKPVFFDQCKLRKKSPPRMGPVIPKRSGSRDIPISRYVPGLVHPVITYRIKPSILEDISIDYLYNFFYYAPMKKPTGLPHSLRPFFWDYRFSDLTWEQDRDLSSGVFWR